MYQLRLLIIVLFAWGLCIGTHNRISAEDTPDKGHELSVYRDPSDQLLYIRCRIEQNTEQHAYRRRYQYQQTIKAYPQLRHVAGEKMPIQSLYVATLQAIASGGMHAEYIWRVPEGKFPKQGQEHTLVLQFVGQTSYANKTNQQQVHIRWLEEAQGAALKEQWRKQMKFELQQTIDSHEDHEAEMVLYWRLFGELPQIQDSSWKRDDVLRFFYGMSGLNDLRDAIPNSKKINLQITDRTLEKPKPLMLPQVAIDKNAPEKTSLVAQYIPRSCYYIEWKNTTAMQQSIDYVCGQYDQWSQGTYQLTAAKAIDRQLQRLGIMPGGLEALQGVRAIAVGGWDPYIQSGTNMLMVFASDQALPDLSVAPFHKSLEINGQHITLIASCQRLLDMAQQSDKCLAHVPAFRTARKRLSVQENEREFGFVYLSDFWLTNYISPRWMILSARRRQIDARIRIAYILKEMYRAEHGEVLTLHGLREQKIMQTEVQDWILHNLIEKDGRIVDKESGGIGAHMPIDEITFDKITVAENKFYEDFRNLYRRRWRQMDPIAFEVVRSASQSTTQATIQTVSADIWKTRLYVSPISNMSNFRFMRDLFLSTKQQHRRTEQPGSAYGLSVFLQTKLGMPMGLPAKFPVSIIIQAMGFDAAPSSYAPSSWLDELPQHDWMSYARMPVAVIIPQILFQQAGIMGGLRGGLSEYEDLQVVNGLGMESFLPIYSWQGAERADMAVSLTPQVLTRMKDSVLQEVTDPVASDIHLWFDFKEGYHMTRKLWQMAVKNRSMASWRRDNRVLRMQRLLGISTDKKAGLVQRIQNGFYFPTQTQAASLHRWMPLEKSKIKRKHYNSYGSASSEFNALPTLLFDIERIDAYVSVEENALYFENHIQMRTDLENDGALNEAGGLVPEGQEQGETGLDFDD